MRNTGITRSVDLSHFFFVFQVFCIYSCWAKSFRKLHSKTAFLVSLFRKPIIHSVHKAWSHKNGNIRQIYQFFDDELRTPFTCVWLHVCLKAPFSEPSLSRKLRFYLSKLKLSENHVPRHRKTMNVIKCALNISLLINHYHSKLNFFF